MVIIVTKLIQFNDNLYKPQNLNTYEIRYSKTKSTIEVPPIQVIANEVILK